MVKICNSTHTKIFHTTIEFISGVYWVPIEAYFSWCQQTILINFTLAFTIFLVVSTVTITVICQIYIQVQLGMNSINCSTIKHIFYVFPFCLGLSLIIGFAMNYATKITNNDYIYLKFHVVVASTVLVNSFITVGFVLKNHENTFPILKSLLPVAMFSSIRQWVVEHFIQDDRVYEINL